LLVLAFFSSWLGGLLSEVDTGEWFGIDDARKKIPQGRLSLLMVDTRGNAMKINVSQFSFSFQRSE
jgi:predicted NUDIX family NTP pyrophosphohydrolase